MAHGLRLVARALVATLVVGTSCDRLRAGATGAAHPLEFGVTESPTTTRARSPWVEPSERSLRDESEAARRAFEAGLPDPVGGRYAQCGRDFGWVVAIPHGQMILDWSGKLQPCDDPRDTPAPLPGGRFLNVARAVGLPVSIARERALTRALIVRSNIGSDALEADSARSAHRMEAVEAWAIEAWRVALAHFVGDIEGASVERAAFFARVSLAAIGAWERSEGSTRGHSELWFAPVLASLSRQLDEQRAQRSATAAANADARDDEPLDGGEERASLDASTASDASHAASVARVVMDVLLRRRTGANARLNERLASPPRAPASWVSAAMIERAGDPAIIDPLLEALARDERWVAARVTPSEHAERERPARVYELAYAVLAMALAFDPIFQELGPDGVIRARANATEAHRAFVSGDARARAELAARFRARMGDEPVTRASMARWQLSDPSLGSIATAAARRLPTARTRMPTDPARRAQIEERMRADAELLVRRADALFEENQSWSCGALAEVERVHPAFVSPAYSAMIERFAVHSTLSGESVACVGRVLRPRAGEAPSAVEQRYAQWLERVGAELYSVGPCETIALGAERTASASALREHALPALESLREERGGALLLRALVRWVRPEAVRCAAGNPAYRDWVRIVLARAVPLGNSLSRALRDGEAWGRRRRCPVVHDGYERAEHRIALRDLAGVAWGFADTREPCAVAARAPSFDAMRFGLEAAVRAE